MFEGKMNEIYDRFAERTESFDNESFMVLAGRMLCLSASNMVNSLLQIFITLGEMSIYGLSYIAKHLSCNKKD